MINSREDGRVALIKSLATGNRFYALVPRESSISNADVVDEIPHDLLLGIAYPCLEDGLNDFAVIRTAYETLALFPDDAPLQRELHEIISDARRTLTHRLMELLERIIARRAHFLGTNLEEFKSSALDIMQRGFPRHSLDGMMKVNVFSSVARAEAQTRKRSGDVDEDSGEDEATAIYRYEFHNSDDFSRLSRLPGREFLLSLMADVLDSVLEDDNYKDKNAFDKNVFQGFIALIFTTYAATDSAFYGTHKDDYGVSRDKDMDDTPLYLAIGRELRRIAVQEFDPGNRLNHLEAAALEAAALASHHLDDAQKTHIVDDAAIPGLAIRDANVSDQDAVAGQAPGSSGASANAPISVSAEELAFFEAIGAAAEALSSGQAEGALWMAAREESATVPAAFAPQGAARDSASRDASSHKAPEAPDDLSQKDASESGNSNGATAGEDAVANDDEARREPALGECVPAFPALRAHEELLLGPIASICATAKQMNKRAPHDSTELTQIILTDAARLVRALKSLRLISPLAYNPGEDNTTPDL